MRKGRFSIPKQGRRTIAKKEIQRYPGWQFVEEVDSKTWVIGRKYNKFERLEIKVRSLFKMIGFEDCIQDAENFWYTDLGFQIDACGGVDDHFFVVDCTAKTELGSKDLSYKVKDNAAKIARVRSEIRKKFGGKYKKVHFVICTLDIEPNDSSIRLANDNKITIIDGAYFDKLFDYVDLIGETLRYQFIKRVAGESAIIGKGYFEYPALMVKSGTKVLYNFTIDPETLLKIGYVYRMEEADEVGYQRHLKKPKLKEINEFLAHGENYFANSLVLGFDHNKLAFETDPHRKSSAKNISFGTLKIPKLYCTAEIIDGQHRLYGYVDTSEDGHYSERLNKRRQNDRLSVVAIADPNNEEKSVLFLDINSHQTKISARHIWALVGKVRPKTLMGFISNIIKALSEKDIFRNKISIPGVHRGQPLNIANFGKGIFDRKILHKGEKNELLWNLFEGDRNGQDYPATAMPFPVKVLEKFFLAVRDCDETDWRAGDDGFLCTNNGINVMLRVLVEILKYFEKEKISPSRTEFRRALQTSVRKFMSLPKNRSNLLRRRTSSESGREQIATDILYQVHLKNRDIAYDYLRSHNRL